MLMHSYSYVLFLQIKTWILYSKWSVLSELYTRGFKSILIKVNEKNVANLSLEKHDFMNLLLCFYFVQFMFNLRFQTSSQ